MQGLHNKTKMQFQYPHKTQKIGVFMLLFFAFSLEGKSQEFRVPISNRTFKIFEDEGLNDSLFLRRSFIAYRNYLDTNQVIRNSDDAQLVKKVGERFRKSVEKHLKESNQAEITKNFKWEFNLVDDEEQSNAWCLPGGKMAISSGILPICEDEDGVAVIIGHEIAHAIANHSKENISRAVRAYHARKTARTVLSIVRLPVPIGTKQIFYEGFKAYTNLDLLRYNRQQELEADLIGIKLMDIAGYDPKKAIEFWKRMAVFSEKKKFNILGTHPTDEQRIKNLEKILKPKD